MLKRGFKTVTAVCLMGLLVSMHPAMNIKAAGQEKISVFAKKNAKKAKKSKKKKITYKGILNVTINNFEKEVLKTKGKVIVDFGTKWCGYCQALEPIYKEASKIKPEYKFTKVDADKESELAEVLEIESYPTLHLYENGELIDIGGYWPDMDAQALIDWIEEKR